MIRVGSQTGGREATKATDFIHHALNNVFFFNSNLNGYFVDVDFFVLALRISGASKDFGSEGPENLKKVRGKKYYTIDLVVPEECWKNKDFNLLKQYFLDGVSACFELLVAKSKKDGLLVDEKKLRFDFEEGLNEIVAASHDDDLFHVSRGLHILNDMVKKTEGIGKPVDKALLMKNMENGVFEVA